MFSLDTLQFDKLLEIVVRGCKTDSGRMAILESQPLTDRLKLKEILVELGEAQALRENNEYWHFTELEDPEELFSILQIQNTSLDTLQIRDLAKLSAEALEAKLVITRNQEEAPTLIRRVENLPDQLKELVSEARSKITPNGELDDTASPQLRKIRREISS